MNETKGWPEKCKHKTGHYPSMVTSSVASPAQISALPSLSPALRLVGFLMYTHVKPRGQVKFGNKLGTNNGCSNTRYSGTADPYGRSRPDSWARPIYWFAAVMQERPLSREDVGTRTPFTFFPSVFVPSSGHFPLKQMLYLNNNGWISGQDINQCSKRFESIICVPKLFTLTDFTQISDESLSVISTLGWNENELDR